MDRQVSTILMRHVLYNIQWQTVLHKDYTQTTLFEIRDLLCCFPMKTAYDFLMCS